jgi:hypothetical protein
VTNEKGFLSRLEKIDSRVLYLILAIVVTVPILWPMGLPLSVGEHVRALYDFIDDLEPGSIIVLSWDVDAATKPEWYPQGIAIIHHAVQNKNVNVVTLALRVDGAIFADEALREIFNMPENMPTDEHPDYGVRFINLGYVAGGEAAVTTMATDLHSLVKIDHYGNPLEELRLTQDLVGLKDVALTIALSTGRHIWIWWEFLHVPWGTPLGIGGTGAITAAIAPLYPTDVVGYIGGLRGAAEYEYLVVRPGSAIAAMDAQLLAHVVIILFIVLGNFVYFLGRIKRGQDGR